VLELNTLKLIKFNLDSHILICRYNLRSSASSAVNKTQAKVPQQNERSRLEGYVVRNLTSLTAEVATNLLGLGESSSRTETSETEIVQTMLTQQSVTTFCGTRGEVISWNFSLPFTQPGRTTPQQQNLSLT